MQCAYGQCLAAWHPLCALRNGIRVVASGPWQLSAYCKEHESEAPSATFPPSPAVPHTLSVETKKDLIRRQLGLSATTTPSHATLPLAPVPRVLQQTCAVCQVPVDHAQFLVFCNRHALSVRCL